MPTQKISTGELLELIGQCAKEVSEQQQVTLPADIGPDTRLFGKPGLFDSIGLVSLVLAVEEAVEDEYGVTIALADQRAMSQNSSPFRSMQSLAEHACQQIEEVG
jgi:acyl carrier protein